MDIMRLLILLLFFLKCVLQVDSFIDPATIGIAAAVATGISYLLRNPETKDSAYKYTKRVLNKVCEMVGYCEGCEDYWIPVNLQGLEYELKKEVIGQSLAVETILSALKGHLKSRNPGRSLVLSFQGSPGTGKNFVSQKILKNMFKKGSDTKYVKFYRGSIDFLVVSKIEDYKVQLVKTIKDMVIECHRSVFVFDEVEKMPNGLLDVISGFVSIGKEGDYDYRRVVFILLSNVGSEALTQTVLKAWEEGIPREEISLKELTRLLAIQAYNSPGGLKNTRLVKNHDISHFVPFLPLSVEHIGQCLKQEIENRDQIMSPELTELVLEELNLYPFSSRVFSPSGCKGIAEVADRLIERESRRRRRSNQ